MRWRALDFANRRRTETIAVRLRTLPDLLGDEFILMKGSDYAYRLYPAPELRPSGDIDVLVRHERIDAIGTRLEQRGFNRVYSGYRTFTPRWPDRKFDLGDVSLEIHHSIVNRSRAAIDYESLWHNRVPSPFGHRFSDVDAFLVSVLNIVKDDMAVPLLRYLDLWLMLRDDPSLIEQAAELARRWRILNSFQTTMRALAATFPDLALPHDPLHVERLRTHLSLLARFWRKLWLIDGWDQRVAYAADMVGGNVYGFMRQRRTAF